MASINPYLIFKGNCEEAFNFYKSIFGGEFPYVGRFKDMPPSEDHKMTEEEGNMIMHISLPMADGTILMGSDSSDSFGHATVIGSNFSLSVNANDKADADRIFNGLTAGGKATMPMAETFWGSYFGMVVDKFGINWMVSFEQNKEK